MKDQTKVKKGLKNNLLKILSLAGLVSLSSCVTTEYRAGVALYEPFYTYPSRPYYHYSPPPAVLFEYRSYPHHNFGHHRSPPPIIPHRR